ncbi:MAG TPA: haloacid dehalogenase type II [Caldimonas sp.]|jgi:2-haloacid dehalogenase|nr:haloacid dehalogenase type II [Caldimonas sp.]HEV7578216.1 haloacid dehalogenase type II [Caldimonas sp.]
MSRIPAGRIRALVFDVFGTVVDWRGSLVREGEAISAAKGVQVDWPAFADAWRAGYQPAMEPIRTGAAPWRSIDALHREILETLLPRFGLSALSEDERRQLNLAWHRLDPWADSVAGLQRLKQRFTIATLSNGNVSLLVDMARRAGLPWDTVLSAELIERYKPDRAVYRMAARLLGVAPGEVAMVAAHPSDLDAARQAGLPTAYVARPLEHGATVRHEAVAENTFDWQARDFADLATQLGC